MRCEIASMMFVQKGEDPGFAERKLEQAMRSKEIAESEVQGRYQETEANKQNMVREGLVCVAQAHLSMARKCSTLFEAYESICQTIPTRSERDSEPPPFTDSSKVASVCQSAIRMADRAQVVRSASYAIGEDLTGTDKRRKQHDSLQDVKKQCQSRNFRCLPRRNQTRKVPGY
eukprot:scpid39982/ scgid3468/ 